MIILSVLFLVGVITFAMISGHVSSGVSDEEVLILNDIAKEAEENWDNPDSLGKKDYGVDFVILDNLNKEIYKSPSAANEISRITSSDHITVETSMKKRLPYKFIMSGDTVVGTAVLLSSENKAYMELRRNMIIALSVMAVLFILGAVGYGLYVEKNIIKPFQKMEDFAGKVAQGRLDEPLMMEKNNMFGVFSESFDIMREELSASKKREEELQRKEKEMVASLSHDLKTPITGIKLSAELLKAKMSQEEGTDARQSEIEKLDNIYEKAEQMDKLISDLFSSTLNDLGEIKVNLRDEDSDILSSLIRQNDDRGLVVEAELPRVVINIDKNRMSQVIGNIIVNSYKYANTKIDVEYKLIDGFLEMKIRDYGPGVSEEDLPHITTKFYRGKNAEEKQKEGSGLGLYISSALMEKMNGELICESKEKGFTVTLLIPLS